MPDNGVVGAGIPEEKKDNNPRPAIARSSRFLNLSLFPSKRSFTSSFSSSSSSQYPRSASIDSSTTTCLAFHSFRDALSCEHPMSPPARESPDEARKMSRWWRFGFGGKKNRAREETAPPKEPKKARMDKWVACGEVSRIARTEPDDSRSHYELVKPVLEPMRFVTSDLAQCPEEPYDDESQSRKKLRLQSEDQTEVLVTQLRSKRGKEQGVVAGEVRVLASEYPPARVTLASLGAIAPLISMLDSPSVAHTALLTLHTLASGNDVNKAAIVDAGVVPKLLNMLPNHSTSIQEAVVANFLSLSALDRNKPLMGTSIKPLIETLKQGKEAETLRALYNLSLSQPNIKFFAEGGAATVIVEILTNANAEKALAVLGNMVGVGVGRKCVTEGVVGVLIGVLGWGVQFAKCVERAAYVLMVVAHYSYGHRQAMVQKRAIPALLEVSLLGSALAQKRCVRILECLREDREQGRPMSAPMAPPPRKVKHELEPRMDAGGEGSKVVRHMVQQSLEQNLQRIVRRANLPLLEVVKGDGVTRAFSLSGCSSSKSLPF